MMASLSLADLATHSGGSSSKSSVMRQQSALPSMPTCSLCSKPISDPWTLIESGESFDKACIDRWLQSNDTCPVTSAPLVSKTIVPNFILRDIVNSGLKEGAPVICPVGVAPTEKLVRSSIGPESAEGSYDAAVTREDRLDDVSHQRGQLRVGMLEQAVLMHTLRVQATQYDTLMELLGSDMPDLQEEALTVLLNALRAKPQSCGTFIRQGVVLGVVAVCCYSGTAYHTVLLRCFRKQWGAMYVYIYIYMLVVYCFHMYIVAAFTLYLHTVHTDRARTQHIHIVPAHRACTQYLHTVHTHSTYTSYIHTAHTHSTCTSCLHTAHTHRASTSHLHTVPAHDVSPHDFSTCF